MGWDGIGMGFVWHVFDETDTDALELALSLLHLLVPFISYLVLLVLFPLLSTHSPLQYLPALVLGPWSGLAYIS
jgi:hypothetical protein